MNTEFIRSFALLFGATIALICSVYVFLGSRRKRAKQIQQKKEIELPNQTVQE